MKNFALNNGELTISWDDAIEEGPWPRERPVTCPTRRSFRLTEQDVQFLYGILAAEFRRQQDQVPSQ
jgi:hypothetical protein